LHDQPVLGWAFDHVFDDSQIFTGHRTDCEADQLVRPILVVLEGSALVWRNVEKRADQRLCTAPVDDSFEPDEERLGSILGSLDRKQCAIFGVDATACPKAGRIVRFGVDDHITVKSVRSTDAADQHPISR
jgi:hypothetical protein